MGEQERAQQLLDYYYNHRVKNQLDFYDKRTEKLDARDRTLRIVAGLLMIGTTLASIGHIFQDSWSPTLQLLWSLLMLSLLPALSTAFLTLRNVHQYEKTIDLFLQSYQELCDLAKEYGRLRSDPDLPNKIKTYIERVEQCLLKEHAQWLTNQQEIQPADVPASRH